MYTGKMSLAFIQIIWAGFFLLYCISATKIDHHHNSGGINDRIDSGAEGRNLNFGVGNIGCTFSNTVCDPKLEFCYNDNAFGRCLPQFGSPTESNLYRYTLGKGDMHLLEKEIERLFAQGYRWGHSYTQCVLQNLLNAFRHGLDLEKSTAECSVDQDQDLKGAMKAFADEIDPLDLAFIKFSPTPAKTHVSDFANELYSPAEVVDEGEVKNLSNLQKIKSIRKSSSDAFDGEDDLLNIFLQNYLLEELARSQNEENGRIINSKKPLNQEYENLPEWKDYALTDDGVGLRVNEKIIQPRVFSVLYNTPDLFRDGLESRDLAIIQKPEDDESRYTREEDLSKLSKFDSEEIPIEYLGSRNDENERKIISPLNNDDINELEKEIEEVLMKKAEDGLQYTNSNVERSLSLGRKNDGGLYTEGGVVFLNNNPKRFFFQGDEDEDDDDLEVEYGRGSDNRNGFERRERLDVKKPGPWYRTVNNFAFDYEEKEKEKNWEEQQLQQQNQFNSQFGGLSPADMIIKPQEKVHKSFKNLVIPTTILEETKPLKNQEKNEELGELMKLMTKKASPTDIKPIKNNMIKQTSGDLDDQMDIIDTSYINVVLLNKIGGWHGAQDLVNLIADLLDLKHSTFIEVRETGNTVTFKVGPNEKKLNSTEIAGRIEKLSPQVWKESGVHIVNARVGIRTNNKYKPTSLVLNRRYDDEDTGIDTVRHDNSNTNSSLNQGVVKHSSPEQLPISYATENTNNNLYIATFATCGIVAAILVAAFIIFFIRKNARSKEKFARLAQDDPSVEACRDYQDLCRARMASKNNEKTEPLRAVQRIQSHASRESEKEGGGTSSSRSSTSSWTDEQVPTNMDIATGHMVLSYMEDHLKNKDKLDQEWSALCTYQPDPGSMSIAEKPENVKKNRYSNSLPFDHSRIILNDLANIAGTDYINASTITDHDPRNPAYIATQGPLATTSADFWQMVWEQGSVVIVSLTRLSDNGNTLCHRYWPEEGSELLHIYEIHLVSEHIWCEEYLVRSFYLKNVKTGETRTVTQFQFLAWPENGIPTSTKAILEFRRKVNKSYRGRSCPIIVHCSDGAGRTGTYCLIDMVLNRMRKGAKEIDIAASLEHIRDQRPGMVRTKQQFEFVLMAVAEEVHAILKALPQ